MKSDREFINGIYAKADIRKNQKTSSSRFRKPVMIPMAAAAMLFMTFGLAGDSIRTKLFSDANGNSTSQANLEQSRLRTASMEYEIEGEVIEVLDSYMGYGRIRVKLDSAKSDLMEIQPIIIAYPETAGGFQEGQVLKATLITQTIGTQEYYVIANGKE